MEETYENDALTEAQRFAGLFSTITPLRRDAAILRANPLGLYINGLNRVEDLATGDET